MDIDEMNEVLAEMPMEWKCVGGCNRVFPNRPDAEAPFAVKIVTDQKTGLQRIGGHVCKECYDK